MCHSAVQNVDQSSGVKHLWCIVVAQLFTTDYIDDVRYMTRDLTAASVKELLHTDNVFLSNKEASTADSDLTNFRFIAIIACEQIVVGEESFLDHVCDYTSPSTI